MIPGVLLAAMFSLAILIACIVKPKLSGSRSQSTWNQRFRSLVHLLPPITLFLVVVGSIYAGLATPTEAASLGVVAALGFGFWRRRINKSVLLAAFEGTMRTTAMVTLIVVIAFFLNFVLQALGIIQFVDEFMDGLNISPTLAMLAIIAFYLVLGMFMETLSMMIATTPIVVPVILALGFDQIWFGVVFMILIEAALITPPIGVNLFVVQAVRGRGPFRDVVMGSLPFLIMMIGMLLLLLAFPDMALLLPRTFN
jgi:tripartite ATP-independent transporter DctM subunit